MYHKDFTDVHCITNDRNMHAYAEKWLQLAMDLAVVTMFGRFEVCHMKHSDFRGDWLYAIREKSNRKSKEAFFRFPVDAVLPSFGRGR